MSSKCASIEGWYISTKRIVVLFFFTLFTFIIAIVKTLFETRPIEGLPRLMLLLCSLCNQRQALHLSIVASDLT